MYPFHTFNNIFNKTLILMHPSPIFINPLSRHVVLFIFRYYIFS